jgi:hypothetical protein
MTMVEKTLEHGGDGGSVTQPFTSPLGARSSAASYFYAS